MLSARLTTAMVSALLAITATAGNGGGGDTIVSRDYAVARRHDAWTATIGDAITNAAALTRLSSTMATARLQSALQEGGLTDFDGSPRQRETQAGAQAVVALTQRTVAYGSIDYSFFTGHDMAASAFISPRHKPFDIVEDSLTNTGTMHRNTYRLHGAVGHSLMRRLAIGGSLDYTAADNAKYRDLRHKNKLMNLQAQASLYAPLTPWLQMGVAAHYHRTTESLVFSTYGKGDRTYNSLISYAAFMGTVEQFGTIDGYTDKGHETPLVDNSNGLTLHLGTAIGPVRAYASASYSRRNGYYGRHSPYTITHSKHESDIHELAARLRADVTERLRIAMDMSIRAENMENRITNHLEQTNDAGATYYEYFAPLKTANHLWSEGALAITADIFHEQPRTAADMPAWTIEAAYAWDHRKQTAYLYPFMRRQRLTSREASLCATRNIPWNNTMWTIAAKGAIHHGSGQPFEDSDMAGYADAMDRPATMDAYLWREYQWLTAPQYSVRLAARCAFRLPKTDIKAYIEAAAAHRKANQTYDYSAGSDRTAITFAVGCDF